MEILIHASNYPFEPAEIPCNAQQNRFKDAASLSHTAEAPLMTPTQFNIHR